MDFEAVLELVRLVEVADAVDIQLVGGGFVERDVAHGHAEYVRAAQREALEWCPVSRSEQHDPAVLVSPLLQQRIGARGDRPRVDVAGVRHDEGLGRRHLAVLCLRQQCRNGRRQFLGVAGVELAGDGGCPDQGHESAN